MSDTRVCLTQGLGWQGTLSISNSAPAALQRNTPTHTHTHTHTQTHTHTHTQNYTWFYLSFLVLFSGMKILIIYIRQTQIYTKY